MQHLNFADYAIICAYFAILVFIGLYLKRMASASLQDYFLAGRKMPWWALGISNMAAWFDMTGTMIITSFLFLLGPRGLYIEFRGGAGLVLVFLMLWLGKWHRRSQCMTGAEWMIYRFGSGFWGQGARIISAVATIVMMVGMLAYSFKGAGLFLSMFLPFSPWFCTLLMLLVTTLYTIESGFYGVIVTDIFQTLCIWAGVIFITILAVGKAYVHGDLTALAQSVTGNKDWITSVPQWHTSMPRGYENYSFLTMIGLFYLVKTFIQGIGMGTDPRYFGARSDKECGLLSFLCGWFITLRWPLMMGFAVLGLFLVKDLFPNQAVLVQAAELIRQHAGNVDKSYWPEVLANIMNHPDKYSPQLISGLQNLMGANWASKLSLLSYEGTVDPERILPAVLLFNIPMGLRGLILVALLAAAMSTFNALINIASGFFTRDIYQAYLRPKAGNRELIRATYTFGIFLVGAGFAMAYTTASINDIWGWLTMGLVGGLSVPTVLRLYWWRFNGGGFAIGTFVGLVGAIAQRILQPQMPEWQQFVIITTIGLLGSIIGTYATEPTARHILEHFYRTTRPFGLWKPLKHILPAHVRTAMLREHRSDIISIPFAMCWQITLLLIPLQLIIGEFKDTLITFLIFLVGLWGVYKFWYKELTRLDGNSQTLETVEGQVTESSGEKPCKSVYAK